MQCLYFETPHPPDGLKIMCAIGNRGQTCRPAACYIHGIFHMQGVGGWSVTCSMGKFAFLTMKSIRFFISFVFQILINSYERCAYDISINAENSEKVRKQTISVLTEVCFKCRFFTLVHQRIVKNDTFSSNYLLIPKIKKNNKKSKFLFLEGRTTLNPSTIGVCFLKVVPKWNVSSSQGKRIVLTLIIFY